MSQQQPVSDPFVGVLLDGRYLVDSRIARGGMATVYLGEDQRLQRQVAIKIMHPHLAENPGFREKFMHEALASARLTHPNVVSIYDHGEDGDCSYLVMEYLPGMTLRELLTARGSLSVPETIDIMRHVLSGLASAHRAGIVHRDLKPENIILVDDGRIKIADFGLARAATDTTEADGVLVGTVAYLSPELITRAEADARSDVYAIGIILYEMLTGTQPFTGDQAVQIAMQHVNQDVPPPGRVVADVPEALDDLVLWSTARNPAERPKSASEVLERLRTLDVAPIDTGELSWNNHALNPTLQFAGTQLLGGVVVPPTYPTPTVVATAAPPLAEVPPVSAASDQPIPEAATRLIQKQRRRAGTRVAGILAALVLIAAAAFGGWYFGAGPGASIVVPDVTALTPAAAAASLTSLGFEPTQVRRHSPSVKSGAIIETVPKAGTRLNRNDRVQIMVSNGPRMVALPDLIGSSSDAATAALSGAGLAKGTTSGAYSSQPVDTVLAMATSGGDELQQGSSLAEGSKVALTLSLGPLPDLRGLGLAQARATLTRLGLGSSVKRVFDDTAASGDVIAQSSDLPLAKGGTVKLTVSKGPELIAVPNVVGKSIPDATDALTAAGFKVANQTPTPGNLFDSLFAVQEISPAAGTMAPKGSTVTITKWGTF